MSRLRKALAVVLVLSILTGMSGFQVLAGQSSAEDGKGQSQEIQTVPAVLAGFEPLEKSRWEFEQKPSLPQLGLPETLTVFLSGEMVSREIEVTWVCADDYANTQFERYTFTPVWDSALYTLGPDAVAPEIEVVIAGQDSSNSREGVQVTPGESDFAFTASTGTITGLKPAYLAGLTEEQKQNIHLVIPETIGGVPVKAIGASAFRVTYTPANAGCRFISLDLTGALSLESIGDNAFIDDADLSGSLVFPPNVRVIGEYAFSGTSGFTGTLQLPDSIREVKRYAFSKTSLSGTLTLPEGLETIGDSAFREAHFTGTLVLPQSLKNLGTVVFSGNAGITQVDLTKATQLTALPASTFRSCGLTGVVRIPEWIQSIGAKAFGDSKLETIYLPKKADPANTKFLVSNSFGSITSTTLQALVCADAEDYAYVKTVLTGSKYPQRLSYEMTVRFLDGSDTVGTIERLYNQPYNFVKDAQGNWATDSSYQFPQISGKQWGLTASSINPVKPTDLVTTDILHSFISLEKPVITYSDGIDKVYDGVPQALTVTAAHPLAKPIGEAGPGDVVFDYTWTWGTIGSSPAVLAGFDKNTYLVTDVRAPYAITCSVRVRACLVNEQNKAVVFDTQTHDFVVDLRQAKPAVNPNFPTGLINTADGLPEISLSKGDTPGTIRWDDSQTLQEGEHEYTWTFTPETNAENFSNYETAAGTATLTGVNGRVLNIQVNQDGGHGSILSPTQFQTVAGSQVKVLLAPDAGYRAQVMLNGTDISGDVKGDSLTLPDVQEDCQITVSFVPLSPQDVEEKIEGLTPVDPQQPPTPEQTASILEAKQNFEELSPQVQAEVSQSARDRLNEAVASLPGVSVVVSDKVAVPGAKVLLENMTAQDAKTLAQDASAVFEVALCVEDTQPTGQQRDSILSQLGDGKLYGHYDVSVVKTIRQGSQETTQRLDTLTSPVRMVFPIPQELSEVPEGVTREFFLLRTHEEQGKVNTQILQDLDAGDPTSITVESDKFSVYSLAWRDTVEEPGGSSSSGADSSGGTDSSSGQSQGSSSDTQSGFSGSEPSGSGNSSSQGQSSDPGSSDQAQHSSQAQPDSNDGSERVSTGDATGLLIPLSTAGISLLTAMFLLIARRRRAQK